MLYYKIKRADKQSVTAACPPLMIWIIRGNRKPSTPCLTKNQKKFSSPDGSPCEPRFITPETHLRNQRLHTTFAPVCQVFPKTFRRPCKPANRPNAVNGIHAADPAAILCPRRRPPCPVAPGPAAKPSAKNFAKETLQPINRAPHAHQPATNCPSFCTGKPLICPPFSKPQSCNSRSYPRRSSPAQYLCLDYGVGRRRRSCDNDSGPSGLVEPVMRTSEKRASAVRAAWCDETARPR